MDRARINPQYLFCRPCLLRSGTVFNVPTSPPKLDTVIACPPLITEKVRQFGEHLETYTSGDYNEAQLRVDFLNPMLEALGWDVNNSAGYAEAYRDVVYEDAIKVGHTSKAPDYGFYIGGRAAGGGRKFFLEAKKPSVAIRVDPKSAFQLRRYAYSAQLPLSILTNFKEFIAYDTRIKPSAKDSATAAAVLRIKYTDYAERWHEIASVFSRDAILRGAFDKFAQGKRKRGMEPLGESFLKDIEGWRALLAREIATSNPGITVDDLNFAVQRTIDRILFLRICEDRGIEQPGNLMQLLNGHAVYDRLGQIFRGADDRYNSGIFYFPAAGRKPDPDRSEPPDDLTLDLTIDDKPLKQIIRGLYDMPGLFTSYAFAVIPPEMLGHVYEQFLGKVITLTGNHTVKIEEKPEVRKAGGVYYTPVYIVDYIVKNTVGKLLQGKSPKDAAKLRVLDPASGSGSFLIGAYQFLLDWHLRWYLTNHPEKHCKGRNPALMRIHSPSFDEERDAPKTKSNGRYDYRLTTVKRKDILLNSIYGVDIDPQAVEVTKLSLLLKVLEGESQESLAAQMKFLHQRALPDLGRNIKCGNSLIGDDFDDGELSEDERKKINKFNWQKEFAQIFKRGAFDAVIGNPPYVRIQTTIGTETAYLAQGYETAIGNFDIYCLFVERALSLLKRRGAFGYIIPHRCFKTAYGEGLRSILSTKAVPSHIVDFDGFMVFDNASINTCILIIAGDSCDVPDYTRVISPATAVAAVKASLESGTNGVLERGPIESRLLSSEPWVFVRPRETALWDRLASVPHTLADFSEEIFQGLKTGADSVFVGEFTRRTSSSTRFRCQGDRKVHELESDIVFPLAKGGQMQRYDLQPAIRCIIFPYTDGSLIKWNELQRLYPRTAQYLKRHRPILESRDRGRMKGPTWYGYSRNQALTSVEAAKILVPDYYAHASYCFDSAGGIMFCGGGAGGYGIIPKSNVDPHYLLGCLNSKVVDWYLQKISMRAYQTAFMYTKKYLVRLPIRTIDFSNKSDKAAHDRMVKLVDRMLDLHKKLAAAKSPHDKVRIPRDIEATDRQIDKLVYDLYGLTDEEIATVETE